MKAMCLGLVLCVLSMAVTAADGPALDLQKYPQDTPQNALQSIIKALESKDYSYWIGQLILPEDTKRVSEKHGGVDHAAAKNADPKIAPKMQAQIDALKKLASGKTSEVEKSGIKAYRFIDEGRVAQFELQADKRWCMNVKISTEKNMDNPVPGKSEEPKKAEEPKK